MHGKLWFCAGVLSVALIFGVTARGVDSAPTDASTAAPAAAPNAAPKGKLIKGGIKPQSHASEKAVAQTQPETKKEEAPPKYVTMPFTSPDVRAPRTLMRPSPTTIGVPRPKISAGIADQLKTPAGAGFEPPDWTKPLRDVEFDEGERSFNGDEMDLVGHVRLHLDTIDFAAERFFYSKPKSEMHAQGNVVIVQGESQMTADDIFYQIPSEEALKKPSVLEPRLDEQERAKLSLSHGLITGKNVHMSEPSRELKADSLEYNIATGQGELENARGRVANYYFGAQKIRLLGPASADGKEIWVTTCDQDPPHYKIMLKKALIRDNDAVFAQGAQLEIFDRKTPLYWPQWGYNSDRPGAPLNFDFRAGYHSRIGSYINAGQQFRVDPDATLGVRLYPTTKEGVGLGLESDYNFTKTPASPLFLGQGTVRSLVTTEGRGYLELKHRQELFDDTIMLVQVEKWSDRNFYRDFFWSQYKNRTEPRSFVNVTHTQPGYIATGTVRADINEGFVNETERLPEGSFHLIERPIAKRLYVSYDTVAGYNIRKKDDYDALRLVNVGRLTYDVNMGETLNPTPFYELQGNVYSKTLHNDDADFLLANTLGATLQTRLHRAYPAAMGFSGFKHIVVPSVTYYYRPDPTMDAGDVPFFDFYDSLPGRSRIEAKLDNVVLGRDAQLEEIWQVARLSLFEGHDFWNELRQSSDHEAELDLRPRPWWGWVLAGERHDDEGGGEHDIEATYDELLRRDWADFQQWAFGKSALDTFYVRPYGDYSRLLTYFYYDDKMLDGRLSGPVGFAYSETDGQVFNREVLYGAGYRLGDKWAFAFEHRYDFEQNEFVQQTYEIRRNLHCWEVALQLRDRQQGWDFGVAFNLAGFPGTRIKF